MKLIFFCLLLAPAHGTILRGDMNLNLDVSNLDPDGLESMVMSLARSKKQTPEMTKLRADLKEIILKLVPSPEAELAKAQAALDLEYKTLQGCKDEDVASNKTAFTGLVEQYKTMRAAEVAALDAKDACKVVSDAAGEAKNKSCDAATSLSAQRCLTFSSGGMSQNAPGSSVTCPSGSSAEDYSAFVDRAVAWIASQKKAYTDAKTDCDTKTKEATDKATDCSGKNSAHTTARSDSLAKQGAMDEASCGLHVVCTRYAKCIETQSANYNKAVEIAKAQETKMRAQWINIQRMLCLVDNLGKACSYIEYEALAEAKLKIVVQNNTLPSHTTACTSLVADIPKAGTADYKAKYYDGLVTNASKAPAAECKASCCSQCDTTGAIPCPVGSEASKHVGYCYDPQKNQMMSTYWLLQYDRCPETSQGPTSNMPYTFGGKRVWFRQGGKDANYAPYTKVEVTVR